MERRSVISGDVLWNTLYFVCPSSGMTKHIISMCALNTTQNNNMTVSKNSIRNYEVNKIVVTQNDGNKNSTSNYDCI